MSIEIPGIESRARENSFTPSKDSQSMKPDSRRSNRLFQRDLIRTAALKALVMFRPDYLWKNPVMFVVEIGTILAILYTIGKGIDPDLSHANFLYLILLDIWLIATIWFANFAEAFAEARGKAQAESLRHSRKGIVAKRKKREGEWETVSSLDLRAGDIVIVRAGEWIPGDGDIIAGTASIDESAITGESAPVLREAGSDRCSVTGGTRVLSDEITVQITARPGESFLDKMIQLVEGAVRQRTPNEIALSLVLSAFTLVFLLVTVTIYPMASYIEKYMADFTGTAELHSLGTDVPTLIALLVCLIPTTIGALLAAIGIAGMNRALQANIIAKSGKAVEVAGDIDTLLLDKTGTITMGNRRATRFIPMNDISASEVGRQAALASTGDTTPEGKSILELHCKNNQIAIFAFEAPRDSIFIPFTAQTRMSGIDLPNGEKIRKGAGDAIFDWVQQLGGKIPSGINEQIDAIASNGATPLLVSNGASILGIIVLEDILKPGIRDRFDRLRKMGLRTVMVTGDNPLTARSIAQQAGVDDVIAQATPEAKLAYIRKEQAAGKLVAMMGDGTNDAPALAQADVGVAMNSGTQAAKEAGNMIDLDSDPTKLIEVIEIGKQLLMTRGALTTFSIANDVAKYFAIVPALFAGTLPWLKALDFMNLYSPYSAILAAVIFNALIIPLLIPIALKGVVYRPVGADTLLFRHLCLWGFGGLICPFIGIKLIDLALVFCRIV